MGCVLCANDELTSSRSDTQDYPSPGRQQTDPVHASLARKAMTCPPVRSVDSGYLQHPRHATVSVSRQQFHCHQFMSRLITMLLSTTVANLQLSHLRLYTHPGVLTKHSMCIKTPSRVRQMRRLITTAINVIFHAAQTVRHNGA